MKKETMCIEEMKGEMKKHGFTLHSHNGDDTSFTFTDSLEEKQAPAISCKITLRYGEWRASLCYPHLKMFMHISSGEIQFPHPDFEQYLTAMNHYAAMAERYPPF